MAAPNKSDAPHASDKKESSAKDKKKGLEKASTRAPKSSSQH